MDELESKVFGCSKCPNICSEFKSNNQYRFPEFGMKIRDHKEIMVIGQNPGFDKKLNSTLVNPDTFFDYYESRVNTYQVPSFIEKLGVSLKDVYYTNLVKCPTYLNRPPDQEEINNCFEFLKTQIDIIRPSYIVAFGRLARNTLEIKESEFQFVKQFYYFYHPSYIFRLDTPDQNKIIEKYKTILQGLL